MERAAVEDLRNVIQERLTAAAEEIFGAFRTTISVYEEELHRQRKLLDAVLQPKIKLPTIDLPQHYAHKEKQQPGKRRKAPCPDQKRTERPRVKEEPREFCGSLEGERILPNSTCEISQVGPVFYSVDQSQVGTEGAGGVSDAQRSESYNPMEVDSDHRLLIHTSHGANNQYGSSVSHSNNKEPEDEDKGSFTSSYNARFDVTRGQNGEDQQVEVLPNLVWAGSHQPKLLEKHFRCSRCSEDFDSKTQLDLHMKTHTGQSPSASTAHGSRYGIQHFFATQPAEKSHACSMCGETFPHEQDLQMHMEHHPGLSLREETEGLTEQPHVHQQDQAVGPPDLGSMPDEKLFALKEEANSFSSFQSISGHPGEIWPPAWNSQSELDSTAADPFTPARFEFDGEGKPHRCSICGESFDLLSQLQSHVTTHATERPFSCSVCGRRFSVKGYLTKHMKTHSGVKPHPCARCGKTFRRLEHLRTHMRRHTGEKLFTCEFCGKEFAYQTSYTYHIRVHTGEKPFQCSLCGKRFAVAASLTVHSRKHTGEKPYVCQICGKAFSINTALKMHSKTHARDVIPLEETFQALPLQERLQDLPPQERLQDLPPQETLQDPPLQETLQDPPLQETFQGLPPQETLQDVTSAD